jgi:stage II sporulation protein AA (anti-sigma F factor antagonist)
MFVNYDESCRKLTINFCGEIDHHTCLETAKKTDDVIRKYLPQKVIFDFEDVDFMDSSGIGMLLGRYKKLKSMGITSYIQSPSSLVERIIEISGIYKIMPKI